MPTLGHAYRRGRGAYDRGGVDASVIIPARNAERWIGQQLATLEAQTFGGAWEVLVADNGSTDATRQVAERRRGGRLPSLRVIDASTVHGANFARTRGIGEARGRVLLFCDADDQASPTWVECMVKAADADAFLGGPLDLVQLNTARQRSWYGGDLAHPGVRTWDGYMSWVTSANFGLTAELARALGPFDTQYIGAGDDIAVSWRATLLGVPPVEVPDAVMHYRLRPAGLAAWRHQYVYGKRMVTLYRQFAQHGMRRRAMRDAARSWRYTLTSSAISPFRPPEQRRAALRLLAYDLGRLVGSLEERTIYL